MEFVMKPFVGHGSLFNRFAQIVTVAACVSISLLLSPLKSMAESSTWTSSGDEMWNSAGNWGGNIPTATGTAVIDNGGTVSIPVGVWAPYQDLWVGTTPGGSGTVNIVDGLLSGTTANLGHTYGGSGSATVTSGTWRSPVGTSGSTSISVGYSGTGSLTVTGGYVSFMYGIIGNNSDGTGSATVTGGTWNSTHSFTIGEFGSGSLLLNGGNISTNYGYIGYRYSGYGSVTVTSGTWTNNQNLAVGASGTGKLSISNGTVHVSGTTFTGMNSFSNGTIELSGSGNTQGVLETKVLVKGNNSVGKITFDGGLIRATGRNDNFFQNYSEGDITIAAGGAYFDTNSFSVESAASISGTGALYKIGGGQLTLSASSSYTGGTVINGGSVYTTTNHALGTGSVTIELGSLSIRKGAIIDNAFILNGGKVSKNLSSGTSLVDSIDVSTTLGRETSAQFLDGTTSTETLAIMSFSATSNATNDTLRESPVLSLVGFELPGSSSSRDRTDTFVLQLSIDEITELSYLAWLDRDTNQWVNAVEGNFEGIANFVGNRAYDPTTDFFVGNYGIDLESGSVWAVVDHTGFFAVVPEPSLWALLAFGAAALGTRSRRRRRDASCSAE